MVRTLFLVLCMAILSVSFNNCGRVVPGGGLSSGVISLGSSLGKGACLSELKAVYATSYHSYFRNNCTLCHQHETSHASADLSISYQAFVDKGQKTLGDRIQTPHGPGYTPSATAVADVASLKAIWDPAQAKYETCVASGPGGGTSAGDIALLGKVVPNLNATRNNGTTFVTVSWNVASETDKSVDANKLNATFSVQVALLLDPASARGTAAIQGLYFKNPTLQLNGITGPVSVNDIGLVIEDEEMTQFTIWKNGVLLAVSGTAPVNMAAGLGTGYSYKTGLTTTSKVAFKLKGLVIGGGTAGGGTTGGGGTTTGQPRLSLSLMVPMRLKMSSQEPAIAATVRVDLRGWCLI
jgi:hypothetical protein